MTETIALFGGSFDPPHEGHTKMASYIQQALQVDKTWMLFSINPEKNPNQYASLEHRMNMADILLQDHNTKVELSDLEDKIAAETGRHETFYVLEGLRQRFPDKKFIWVMGADSFAGFHTWAERDDILNNYIVAVVDRPGYTTAAMSSPTACDFSDQIIDLTNPEKLRTAKSGWCLLDNPKIPVSSSDIKQQLAEGKNDFTGPFNQVAEYIYAHGLYGTGHGQITNPPQTTYSMV